MPYVTREVCGYVLHGRGHGPEGTLYQTDWDFPSLAQGLGWSLARVQPGRILARRSRTGCEHDATDGTVTCPDCGVTAGAFISAAHDWLHARARW